MRRKYTTIQYAQALEKVYEQDPFFRISTDVIVGFPQETDQDFRKTCDFIKKMKLLNCKKKEKWKLPE